jgi:hypothetical protein
MRFVRARALPEKAEAHVRVYNCPLCHYEMQLTVWGEVR